MTGSEVRNDRAARRYELTVGGETAIAAYQERGEVIAFTHTEVPEALAGRGIASRLIAGALDDVRSQGRKVLPLCAFVAAYMQRHPETGDLLAEH